MDVGDWFEKYVNVECDEWEVTNMQLGGSEVQMLFATEGRELPEQS
jgi:hypothetical protein